MTTVPRPKFIGLTGTTGSGKTTLATAIQEASLDGDVAVLDQDWYFLPRSACPIGANFFEPRWFKSEDFIRDVSTLASGDPVLVPRLDPEYFEPMDPLPFSPARVIVLTGMTLLRIAEVDAQLHTRYYIDPGMDTIAERKRVRDKEIRKKPDWVIEEEIRWGGEEYEADAHLRARADVEVISLPYDVHDVARRLLSEVDRS